MGVGAKYRLGGWQHRTKWTHISPTQIIESPYRRSLVNCTVYGLSIELVDNLRSRLPLPISDAVAENLIPFFSSRAAFAAVNIRRGSRNTRGLLIASDRNFLLGLIHQPSRNSTSSTPMVPLLPAINECRKIETQSFACNAENV